MTDYSIKVDNLSKCYQLGQVGAGSLKEDLAAWWRRSRGQEAVARKGEFWALKNVSFEVKPGEVLGIIGANGAGKSTLLKVLSRITEPTTGQAQVRGRVASLLEVGTGFHPDLTGRENIFLNGAILGMSRKEITRKFDEIVAFAEIDKFVDTPVKRYSSGMYVRLAFAVAAHLDTDILLVDEVLSIGDYTFQRKSLQKMGELIQDEGKSIIFVSHVLGSVAKLCTRAIQLEKGQVVFQGKTTDVIDRYLTQRKVGLEANETTELRGHNISISEARLMRGEVSTEAEVMMGEDLTLLFSLRSESDLQLDSLSIEIFNRADESMTHISSEDIGLSLPKLKAGQLRSIRIQLKDLLFSPGSYRIAFWLTGNTGKVEEHFPSLLQFQLLKGPCVGRPGEYPVHVKTYLRSNWSWS